MSFEDFTSKSSDKTSVWHHFLRGKDEAKCKICKKVLKSAGGTTTGLRKHLKSVHLLNLRPENETEPGTSNSPRPSSASHQEEPTNKRSKLTDFFKPTQENSISDRICRMLSLDGVPIRLFTESYDLRDVFDKAGIPLPKSANTVREIMLKEYENKRNDLIAEIKQLKSEDKKFSISLDEWTSNRNRRYLNLNLHSQNLSGIFKFRNLGLLRVYGSMPANRCEEQIKQKLNEYGLVLGNDVVAIVSDGCSVMSKLGSNLPCYHQKCIAHAVQLAIVDVFYKKTPIEYEERIEMQEENSDDEEITLAELIKRRAHLESAGNQDDEYVNDEDDNDVGPESDADQDGVVFNQDELTNLSTAVRSEFRFQKIISKVRNVVRIFRKSPTKNDDILQKYVKEEFGKEYTMILDVKTRWSSMADMITRFIKLKSPIAKAIIDLQIDGFSEQELQILKELGDVLEILKFLIEALCRRDASILTAQIAIKFAIKKLSDINTPLGLTMIEALKSRYNQRRLGVTPVLSYLHNPDKYFDERENEDPTVFPRPMGFGMREDIVDLLQRLVTQNEEPIVAVEGTQLRATCSFDTGNDEISLKHQFDEELKQRLVQDRTSYRYNDIRSSVQVEMALYENGGTMGRYLAMAYDYLMTIPPTSVEPERIFSSAGFICSKLRSSLSDKSVDALSFLRSYYSERRAILKT